MLIAGQRSLKSKNGLYHLPHTKNETYIEDYNPTILLAWNGNTDLQLINKKVCSSSPYLTKYQTKSEKSISIV